MFVKSNKSKNGRCMNTTRTHESFSSLCFVCFFDRNRRIAAKSAIGWDLERCMFQHAI